MPVSSSSETDYGQFEAPTAALAKVHQVTESLYISGYGGAKEKFIREFGFTCVINCTPNCHNSKLENVEYVDVPVADTRDAEIEEYFDGCANKIEEQRLLGGKVLVHCKAGVSRSATIVIAYLIKYQKLTLWDAYTFVKNVRPIIKPNSGFWKQLIDYEVEIKNAATIEIVPFGDIPASYFL